MSIILCALENGFGIKSTHNPICCAIFIFSSQMTTAEAEEMLKEKFPDETPELKVMDRDYNEQKKDEASEEEE